MAAIPTGCWPNGKTRPPRKFMYSGAGTYGLIPPAIFKITPLPFIWTKTIPRSITWTCLSCRSSRTKATPGRPGAAKDVPVRANQGVPHGVESPSPERSHGPGASHGAPSGKALAVSGGTGPGPAPFQLHPYPLLLRRADRHWCHDLVHDPGLGAVRRLGPVHHRPALCLGRPGAHRAFPAQAPGDSRRHPGRLCGGAHPIGGLWTATCLGVMGRGAGLPGLPRLYRLALVADGTDHPGNRCHPAVALSPALPGNAGGGHPLVYEHGPGALSVRLGGLQLGVTQTRLSLVWPTHHPVSLLGGSPNPPGQGLRLLALSVRCCGLLVRPDPDEIRQ